MTQEEIEVAKSVKDLTIRDYFRSCAMIGLLSGRASTYSFGDEDKWVAKANLIADEMMRTK